MADRIIDNVLRQVCQNDACRFIHWNNPIPVVAALVEHYGEIILARNTRWPKHIFSSISGYLESNETPEQAVAREVEEELGLQAQQVRFLGHYYFKEKNQLLIGYFVQATGEVKLNHELAEIKRVSNEQLRTYDFRPLYITRAMVQDWLATI
jgi:NADH pyrophosphatase NudC (nudix superfamily)